MPTLHHSPRGQAIVHQLAAVEQGHLAAALAQPAGGAEPAAAAGGGQGQGQVLQGVPGSPSRGVVALFLPRTTLLAELAALVPAGQVWQVERNYVNCRLKGVTFYCYT
ncbi:WW domain-containing protein [Haematococcus lacustris]|uniref:WW domain-containing protein n=1 Tax=Haematococcus lacustris TaxID=44745 RepID=A0A699ZP98_HAELA|nr:WW domain-containing protein [Haematococcus lacustris]